jgi:pimeloyl-ACP methyl ester carboxylesterase
MEVCVETVKTNGQCLRGILHQGNPDTYKNIVLICLNTGLNDMVGWHRIQVKTARFLAEQGFNVLRYDDSGIGDSDGIIDEESIVEIFTQIETGLFVENANSMTDYIADRFKGHQIIFLGFCGGGLTGIFSAASNKKISGVISIGAPVTLSSNEYFHKRDPWVVGKNIENYRSKLFNFKTWLKFLTFRGDYKTVFSSLFYFFKHKVEGAYNDNPEESVDGKSANLNHQFFTVFKQFLKRKIPCMFFYAENDSATWEFKKYFLVNYQEKCFGRGHLNSFHEAPKANHILSSRESQASLRKEIVGWLQHYFS